MAREEGRRGCFGAGSIDSAKGIGKIEPTDSSSDGAAIPSTSSSLPSSTSSSGPSSGGQSSHSNTGTIVGAVSAPSGFWPSWQEVPVAVAAVQHECTGAVLSPFYQVVGVCGAVAIALLVWFLLRRRQKAKRDQWVVASPARSTWTVQPSADGCRETAEVEKPFQVDEYKETTESGTAPALTPYLALPPADAYDRETT